MQLAEGDTRIRFLDSVPNDKIIGILKQYHALVVPSQWLETGPLVVLEAFAAGIPVIGSRLGGISELVTDGVDGILVDADSGKGWNESLRILIDQPGVLRQLRAGVKPPRSVASVAQDMIEIYRELRGKD